DRLDAECRQVRVVTALGLRATVVAGVHLSEVVDPDRSGEGRICRCGRGQREDQHRGNGEGSRTSGVNAHRAPPAMSLRRDRARAVAGGVGKKMCGAVTSRALSSGLELKKWVLARA